MKHDQPISAAQLSRSLASCHRIEDAIAARLNGSLAFDTIGAPPAWCSQEAWERIAASMRTWSTIFGNLSLFWTLRQKRDEQ